MADLPALIRPEAMRVVWDRIILQSELDENAINGFSSGNEPLDHFWLDKSLTYSRTGMCAVHVAMSGDGIVGFYTLSPSAIRGGLLPRKRQAGKPTMSHPAWLIGEFAIRADLQGNHEEGSVGAALLCHALHMANDLSRMGGGRLVMLDPLNERLADWYGEHGFLRLKGSNTMFIPMKKIREYMTLIGEDFFVF